MATNSPSGDVSIRMSELLSVFAFASDLAFGLELEDSIRSCYISMRITDHLGLPEEDRADVYYTALMKDAGCTCWTSELAELWMTDEISARRDLMVFGDPNSLPHFFSWLARNAGADLPPLRRVRQAVTVLRHHRGVMLEGFQNACDVASRVAGRLGLPPRVQEAVGALFEQWDGKGAPAGLAGEQIPLAARIVHPTFFLAPVNRVRGREASRQLARERRGRGFDPTVTDAFLDLAADESFWADVESPEVWGLVQAMEPESPYSLIGEDRFDEVAMAFADYTDLKSPFIRAHSRRVATLAESLARAMGCDEESVALVRRTGLVHDLGLVAIPSFTLNKPPDQVNVSDRERLRLHPYHAERILGRADPMAPIAALVGKHQERMDGNGVYRGLPGPLIPEGARIVAVAARFDELTHEGPGREALSPEAAVRSIAQEAGDGYASDVVEALPGVIGTAPVAVRRDSWPAGLTDREVEVLRLASKGLTRKQVAEELVISENTVRHHLEHIYNKTGTSTRVGATLFAMENGLLE